MRSWIFAPVAALALLSCEPYAAEAQEATQTECQPVSTEDTFTIQCKQGAVEVTLPYYADAAPETQTYEWIAYQWDHCLDQNAVLSRFAFEPDTPQAWGPVFGGNELMPMHWSTGSVAYLLPTLPTAGGCFTCGPANPQFFANLDPSTPEFQYGYGLYLQFLALLGQGNDELHALLQFIYQIPPLDLMRQPADFPGEEVAALDARTYRVEVAVPAGRFETDDERIRGLCSDPVLLRGWYIKGVPTNDDPGLLGIVVMRDGRTGELTSRLGIEGGVAAASAPRVLAARLARAGLDVWIADKRGHGMSGGIRDIDSPVQADDLYRSVRSLATGEGLQILTHDDRPLAGTDAAAELWRPEWRADTVPLVLWGQSQGTYIAQIAMTLNVLARQRPGDFATLYGHMFPRDTRDPAAAAAFYGSFDVRGLVTYDGISSGGGRRGLIDTFWEYQIGTHPGGDFYDFFADSLASAPLWPAHLQAQALMDGQFAPRGAIDLYNRERGLKQIVMVPGPHASTIYDDPVVRDYVIDETIKFARQAIRHHDSNLTNDAQTTLAREVCGMHLAR